MNSIEDELAAIDSSFDEITSELGEIEVKVDEIEDEEDKEAYVPIDLLSAKDGKRTQLVNNSDPKNYLKGRNVDYTFPLEKGVYVKSIMVKTSGYSSYYKMEFSWLIASDTSTTQSMVKISDNDYTIDVNAFITSFSFKPDKKYYGSPLIRSVHIKGYLQNEFDQLCDQVGDILEYTDSINILVGRAQEEVSKSRNYADDFTHKKSDLIAEIQSLEASKSVKEQEVGAVHQRIELARGSEIEANEKLELLRNRESLLLTRAEELEDGLDKKRNEHKALNLEISDRGNELKKLKDNINVFPSEIAGFAEQGAKSIIRYSWFAAIPLLIMVALVLSLFKNAADLTTYYTLPEGIDLWTVLLTRLPFVVIALTLIHACYRIARMFMEEVVKINTQRLNLSKISIIAKDVSDASSTDLGLDNDQIYHRRTQLKMELLREHLQQYISKDYQYQAESEHSSLTVKIDKDDELEENG